MLRKTSIRLSISTKTSMSHFLKMNLFELAETIEDVQEVNKEK